MPEDATNSGASRTKVAGTRVTEEEKRKLEVVAGLHETTVSQLLRVMSVESALREFDRKKGQQTEAAS